MKQPPPPSQHVRLYYSGTPHNRPRYQQIENALCEYRLFSLHGGYAKNVMQWLKQTLSVDEKRPRHIMLDSGAFTAWNKGDEVRVEEVVRKYEEFLQAAGNAFKEIWMINLDKIPGRAGRDPTGEEIAEALVESDRNFDLLVRRFGERILPVFHQGENEERLRVVRSQARYVCLSPRNDLHERVRYEWSYALHAAHPGIMSHGLAATGARMMRGVTWYSVDSASWRLQSAYGGSIVDTEGETFTTIKFSHEGGFQKHWDIHFDTIPQLMRDVVEARLTALGFTVDEVRTNALARACFSISEINRFLSRTPPPASLPQQGGLFDA